MISDILKKLKGRKAPTPKELEAAIVAIDLEAAGERVRASESARRAALLDGADDAALSRLEGDIAAARRDQERAEVALDALRARLAEALEQEAQAAMDAIREEAEREAETVAQVLRERWPDLQIEMVKMLALLRQAEAKVQATNARLSEAGRDDFVRGVEYPRARPTPDFAFEGAVSLQATVVLPEITEWGLSGHGTTTTPAAFWSSGALAAPACARKPDVTS